MNTETLFDALGFRWDRTVVPRDEPVRSLHLVCFLVHRMSAQFVWDAVAMSGNPITLPEVLTLLNGVALPDRSRSQQEKIIDTAAGFRRLVKIVRAREFSWDETTFKALQGEQLQTTWPSMSAARLQKGVSELKRCAPFEMALGFFAWGTSHTSSSNDVLTWLLMMNGALMSNGLHAISVPAGRTGEFTDETSRFRETNDATDVLRFLADCRYAGDRRKDRETVEVECVVIALNPEFQQVRLRGEDGKFYSVTPATSGVAMKKLSERQRVMCTVAVPLPRVLNVRLISMSD